MAGLFEEAFETAGSLAREVRADERVMAGLEAVAEAMAGCLRSGGKVMSCGNGGSLADAMHFAEEMSGRYRNDRPAYAAVAICDPTHLTCVANDYGFEQVFSRMVEGLGRAGDLLVLLTTSGNSANLILAAEAARSVGVGTVGFLGRGGGKLAGLCDYGLVFPGSTSDRIQELHMIALHALVGRVESHLGHA